MPEPAKLGFMVWRRTTIGAVLLLSLVLLPALLNATISNEIASAVQALGSADYKTRVEAMRRLWSMGSEALPALAEAAESRDPEVALTAQGLLEKIKAGILPNTPVEVAQLTRAYRESTEPEAKRQILERMLEYGDRVIPNLDALLRAEANPEARGQIFSGFGGGYVQQEKLTQAYREARECLTLLPGNVEVPALLVPKLDHARMYKEADDLYKSVTEFLASLARTFPEYEKPRREIERLSKLCNRPPPKL